MNTIDRSLVARTGQLGAHQLIQDSMPLEVVGRKTVMTESANGQKNPVMRLAGRFQYAGKPNSNGRIYRPEILRNAVQEIQEDVKARRVLGQLDHPSDARIHLDGVSHLITKIWMEGNEVYGELEVLERTNKGAQLKALIESGVSLGISSRGVGDMKETVIEGQQFFEVQEGYSIVTFDVVSEPSVQGSYLNVMESRNRLKNLSDGVKAREKHLIEEIHNYLGNL